MFRAEIESRSADAAEPAFPAAPLHGGADAGAEPWYKTIAKLMQGRNRNSTHTLRTSSFWFAPLPALLVALRLVATWLILPVVICLS